MSSSISSVVAVVPFDSAGSSSNSARVQQTPSTSSASADTVFLSEAQVVYQLYSQGETVSQIASRLSLSEAAVKSYLTISIAA